MMASLLSERAFKWLRDSNRDNPSEISGELTLWETPTRREVLKAHEYEEIQSSSAGVVDETKSISKSFSSQLFRGVPTHSLIFLAVGAPHGPARRRK